VKQRKTCDREAEQQKQRYENSRLIVIELDAPAPKILGLREHLQQVLTVPDVTASHSL